ncbi:MAG: ZIP family metal transporter [Burkholderiales bacterium]|nr:ZIP family metal transporter [Burkholderiales bacterium]
MSSAQLTEARAAAAPAFARGPLAAFAAIAALGALAALAFADARVAAGAAASLATGLATAIGAAPVLAVRRVSRRAEDAMLGFGAGVMLAACSFSLIVPGVETAEALWASRTLAAAIAAAGLLAGAAFLWTADRLVPHEHFVKGAEGAPGHRFRQVWLFVFAIALHNLPEGLAVGVAFGGASAEAASLAAGIGIQNLPEGLAVALALATLGYARVRAFAVAAATGLAEPLAGVLGAALVALAQPVLPFALAFAAGAMLFVISHEVIPESHRHGHERAATAGVLGGFAAMMLLDIALG